jgi:glucose dehydrogenase
VYNGATANQLWRRQVFEEIRAKPAMDGDTVYVPTMGRTLYAVDRRSGRERWTFHAEQALDKPVYRVGRHLFLPLGKETLLALDHETGQERWRLDESALIPLTTVNEQVIFYGEDQLTLMQEQDGVAIADAQSDPLHTVLTGPNQSLLLVTPDGRLQRLNLGG